MLYPALRPFFFTLPPETAHHAALIALDMAARAGLANLVASPAGSAGTPVKVMGIEFPNRVGIAAGLDKNGAHVDGLGTLGFGFIEIGTVTPRPQPGNPKPRMFRIPAAKALINRMGFNNDGVDRLLENLARTRWRGVLGINIGKNFDTPLERAADDYLICLRKVYTAAHYVAVNISSPNTRGLRKLQQGGELEALLAALKAEQQKLAAMHGRYVPLAVKIAPDLSDEEVAAVARKLLAHGIDGVIATNTTTSRTGVAGMPHATEDGGLSGTPVFKRSTEVVALLAHELAGRVAIIGTGGIMRAADARAKIDAGAALVQVYTGLIYRGPALVGELVRELATVAA
jgi:dihydroorotate dehydrogenase